MLLHKFENKFIIEGKLKALTALHIGSGKQTYSPQDVDNMVIRNANTNEPFIPGSSLKGVLRSYLEMMLPNIEGYEKCCIVTENPCLDQKTNKDYLKKVKNDYKSDAKGLAEELYKGLCPICKLFGSQVMASKLQIKDAMMSNKVPVEKRDGVGINRDTGTAADRVKYTFECVSEGAEFEFLMTVDNLEPKYEKMLRILLHLLESGELTVGGKKSIGLGTLQLIDTKTYKVEKRQLMEYALTGKTEEMRWDYV